MSNSKDDLSYRTIVKLIVKHDLSFTIDIKDEDMRLLAKEVVESIVYLNAMKDSKLRTIKEWCDNTKMDRL